jgi:protein TonB
MSDRYIEKIFLFFVLVSLLLHLAAIGIIMVLPEERNARQPKPYMVELQDLPPSRGKAANVQKEVKRPNARKRPVEQETRSRQALESTGEAGPPKRQAEPGEMAIREKPRAGDFFRQKESGHPDISKLMPSADKLARLEDTYRQKFQSEVGEGETRFLNNDDITLGSFLRRFESAVYGVWRYPSEAARMGIEGVTPVKITFNRKGEIEKVVLLESSGSKILDDEVQRTLKAVGTIGPLPRSYGKETFNLIAFFHYGIERGVIRGILR